MKKLTKEEKKIEEALVMGEFSNVNKADFQEVAESLAARRKDAVLNIRVNSDDLENIKRKARKYGVRYQTLISEWLHRVASF